MNLQIRDPRAHKLAQQLARKRNISISNAVIEALQAELRRESEHLPLAERLAFIADELHDKVKPGGRNMTKEEIDNMWGHS